MEEKSNPFECRVCQKRFTSNSAEQHDCFLPRGTSKCPFCGKGFKSNSIKKHLRIHTREKPYSCDLCNKSFTWLKQIKNHMCTRSADSEENEVKKLLDSFLKNSSTQTKEKPTNEKLYSCGDVTKKHLVTPSSDSEKIDQGTNHILKKAVMNASMGTQMEETPKPCECNLCQKQFYFKHLLTEHELTHTEGKPHKCTLCRRSFTLKETLERHLTIHTIEKPYSCDVCHQSFTLKREMKRHMKTHGILRIISYPKKKAHTCTFCGRIFTFKTSLTKHVQTKHVETPYSCYVCHQSFTLKREMKRHLNTHGISRFISYGSK